MAKQKKLNDPEYNHELRERVYSNYDTLLRSGIQPSLRFPNFIESGGLIYCSGQINDENYSGKTYFCGKVVSKERIGDNLLGIVASTNNQFLIEPFEHYSKRGIRIGILTKRGLVINRTVLAENPNELEGHTIEEVIGLNFALFPNLLAKLSKLSEEDYLRYYLEVWKKNPILF